MSDSAEVISFCDGQFSSFNFEKGKLVSKNHGGTTEKNGTLVRFIPDETIFPGFSFDLDIVRENLWRNACLNNGLNLYLNGELFYSANGLVDFLTKESYFRTKMDGGSMCYEPISGKSFHLANIESGLSEGEIPEAGFYETNHCRDRALEFAFTHVDRITSYFHFLNGAYFNEHRNIFFALGCVHLNAFREGILKGINKYSGQEFNVDDLRQGLQAALSVRVSDTLSERLDEHNLGNPATQTWIIDQVSDELVKYLATNSTVAKALIDKIKHNSKLRNLGQ